MHKNSYFQGTEKPHKYKSDPMNEKLRNTKDRQVKQLLQVFYRNYDYIEPKPEDNKSHTSPGAGLYQNLQKYKSVSEFLNKKRKKNRQYRRIAMLKMLIKMAEGNEKSIDENNLTDPYEDEITPIPFAPAEPSPIGLLDGIYPKSDLEENFPGNLDYGMRNDHYFVDS